MAYGSNSYAGVPYSGNTQQVAHNYVQTLSASLSFTGAVVKQTLLFLVAALVLSGQISKAALKSILGSITFSAALGKSYLKTINAALSFIGSSLLRQSVKILSAAIAYSAALTSTGLFARSFAAIFNSTSILTTTESIVQIFTASLVFTSNQAKSINKQILAALNLVSDNFVRETVRGLSSVISTSTNLTRLIQKHIAAALNNVGVLLGRLFASEAANFGLPMQARADGMISVIKLVGRIGNSLSSILVRPNKVHYLDTSVPTKSTIQGKLQILQTYDLPVNSSDWGYDLGYQPLPPEVLREVSLTGTMLTKYNLQGSSKVLRDFAGSIVSDHIIKAQLKVSGTSTLSDVTFMV